MAVFLPGELMKSRYLAAALLACACAAGAQNLKPGLWEITNKMQSSGGGDGPQMQKQLAAMPPEQRKMVEEMMAKQGVKPGAGGAGRHERADLHDQGDGREKRVARAAGRLHDHSPIAQRQHHEVRRGLHQAAIHRRRPGHVRQPEAYSMKMTVTTAGARRQAREDEHGRRRQVAGLRLRQHQADGRRRRRSEPSRCTAGMAAQPEVPGHGRIGLH